MTRRGYRNRDEFVKLVKANFEKYCYNISSITDVDEDCFQDVKITVYEVLDRIYEKYHMEYLKH